jgi:hypothetical protein
MAALDLSSGAATALVGRQGRGCERDAMIADMSWTSRFLPLETQDSFRLKRKIKFAPQYGKGEAV